MVWTPYHGYLSTQFNPLFLMLVIKDFFLLVHLTVCFKLSSDDLLVLIDIMSQTPFQNPLSHPGFMQMDWATF
jgi:hypothetical protein